MHKLLLLWFILINKLTAGRIQLFFKCVVLESSFKFTFSNLPQIPPQTGWHFARLMFHTASLTRRRRRCVVSTRPTLSTFYTVLATKTTIKSRVVSHGSPHLQGWMKNSLGARFSLPSPHPLNPSRFFHLPDAKPGVSSSSTLPRQINRLGDVVDGSHTQSGALCSTRGAHRAKASRRLLWGARPARTKHRATLSIP